MREIVFRKDGRVITTEEYSIIVLMVKLLVDIKILPAHLAFDLIMQSFHH